MVFHVLRLLTSTYKWENTFWSYHTVVISKGDLNMAVCAWGRVGFCWRQGLHGKAWWIMPWIVKFPAKYLEQDWHKKTWFCSQSCYSLYFPFRPCYLLLSERKTKQGDSWSASVVPLPLTQEKAHLALNRYSNIKE